MPLKNTKKLAFCIKNSILIIPGGMKMKGKFFLALLVVTCIMSVSETAIGYEYIQEKNIQFEKKYKQKCQEYTSTTYTPILGNPQADTLCRQATTSLCLIKKLCTTNYSGNSCDLSKSQLRFSCRVLEEMGINCPACEN